MAFGQRRKDTGQGETINANGKVVSSGAAAADVKPDANGVHLSLDGGDQGPAIVNSYTEYGTFYVDTEPFEIEHGGERYLVEQVTGPANQYGAKFSAVGAVLDEDGEPSSLLRYLPGVQLPSNVTDAVSGLFPDAPPLPPQELPEPAITGASIEDGRVVVPVEPFEAFDGHKKVIVTKFVGGVGANGRVMRPVFIDPLMGEEYLKSDRTPASVVSAARELFRDEESDAVPMFKQLRAQREKVDAERRRRDAEQDAKLREEKSARRAETAGVTLAERPAQDYAPGDQYRPGHSNGLGGQFGPVAREEPGEADPDTDFDLNW